MPVALKGSARFKKFLKLIILLAIFIAAGVWAALFFFPAETPVNYMTQPVEKGRIRKVVNATGEVGASEMVTVGAQVSGQIERLFVKLGQNVKKGDMIAQIDSTTQENDLKINKAKLSSYNAQLDAAKIQLKMATSQYEREKKLYAAKATSTENLENFENAWASARSTVTELESMIVQTQIAVNTAEVNLGYTKIVAPLDGTIVSVPVEEGRTVNANQTTPTIVQLADLTQMEVLMEISEGDVTKVAPGMPVSYTVLSEPGKNYRTTLKSIDPGLTSLTNGTYTKSSSTTEAVYYYGRLVVDNKDGKLHIGMTTQNEIVVAEVKDVLVIPTLAISERKGEKFVHVLEGQNIVTEKKIVTGLSDNMNTEVTSGLSEGEAVIVSQVTASELNEIKNQFRPRTRI